MINGLLDWRWWEREKRELKIRPILSMKVGAGDFIEAGNTGRNRSGQERDQEVNFSEDKCEVSLPCPGLFQSCRAEREKTKGHLKK